MKIKLVLIFAGTLLLFGGCRNKPPKEWKERGPDTSLSVPASYYELPVVYPVARFEEWLNKKFRGTFLTKSLPVNSNDSLYLEITKDADIGIEIRKEKIRLKIPVSVKGFYMKKLAGIQVRNREALEAGLVIWLESPLDLDKNWRLVSETKIVRVEWIKNPKLKIIGLTFDLKNIIDKQVMAHADMLTTKLDEAIYKNVDLEKPIGKIWHDVQKPIFLHKYHPQAWMKILGETISAQIDLKNSEALVIHLKVEGRNYAVLDTLQLPASNPLPRLQKLNAYADSFNITIHGEIPFDLANKVLNEKLRNIKIEKAGYTLKIARIDLKGTHSGLLVRVKVKGAVRGAFYLIGTPVFIPEERKLKIENFRFLVETSDNLLNAADAVLHEAMLAYLNDYLEFDLSVPVSTVPQLIYQGIEKGKAGEKLNLNIGNLEPSGWTLLLSENRLQFQIETKGKAQIELQNLKVKKRVRIK